ncbi:hypothetical protein ACGFZ3_12390 [Stenotrophomonas sp. NPDC047960]|uniref:hypothetical protein n=1 Tax=Stenotrophomonas sp. NPDC047960 TaxID=3364531 RepID=UPI00371EA8F3
MSRNLLLPPIVDAVLPDIAGGEPNLLPVSALDEPLQVEVPMWKNSIPTPGSPERVWLFWNETEIAVREFTAPVTPQDRIFHVEDRHSHEGTHQIRYEVMTFNGGMADSHVLEITVDTTKPTFASGQGMLVFPPDVIADGITGEYLDLHDNVMATVPVYTTPKAGDTLTWFWDETRDENRQVGARVLAQADIGNPIEIGFRSDMIRESGDGTRLARYRVQDRAGNLGDFAGYATLEVKTSVRPRELDWPGVSEATGSGETLNLNPLNALSGVTVVLSDTADIRPDDKEVWIQWGEPGSVGAYRTKVPISDGGRSFRIPKEAVAAYIGGTVALHYEIIDAADQLHPSPHRGVKVGTLPVNGLPTVQCAGVYGGNLSLAAVPAGGAKLTLARWMLISTDQCVTIEMQGLSSSGTAVSEVVLDRHRVTPQEALDGLGAQGDLVIPRSVLEGLKRNATFDVTVSVSFDAGGSWPTTPNFPRLSPTLIA